MEGPDRDQRGNPQGMFMASVDMEPFTKYLDENGNKITIDTVAEMLANQLDGNDANEEELAQFIEHLISGGATVSEDESEEVPVDEGTPIDDNGHPDDTPDTAEDDFDWGDDEEEEVDDGGNETASDEKVKSNKKPCAEEPKPEVASDEKCKENKKPCAEEDSTRFSDESLKNIISVLDERLL